MIIDNEEVCLYYFSTSLLVICAFVIKNEYTLKTEGEGLLKTISVDLRDLLRGDYVILNYEISQFSRYKKRDFNERVDVLLNTNDNKNGKAKVKGFVLKNERKQVYFANIF